MLIANERMKKIFVILLGVLFPYITNAQVRIGITGGVDYNVYSIDTHYMDNWHYEGAIGFTIGVMGQYDFKDWMGLRAELNWTQKNHRQYGTGDYLELTDIDTYNNYLQIPIMTSLSLGKNKLRGIMNIGGYGAWWMSSIRSGGFPGLPYGTTITKVISSDNISFSNERDNRFDFGLVGGIGIEWHFHRDWACQIESRCYYSLTSSQKDYMRIKDPKYNTTYTIQLALWKNI